MRDAALKREYHRLCRKHRGALSDDERSFRAFKAGVEYATIEYQSTEARLQEAFSNMAARLTVGPDTED